MQDTELQFAMAALTGILAGDDGTGQKQVPSIMDMADGIRRGRVSVVRAAFAYAAGMMEEVERIETSRGVEQSAARDERALRASIDDRKSKLDHRG